VNNLSKIGILVFIVLMTIIIIYSISTAEKFGDVYIEQIRIGDSNKTLNELNDHDSIELGKNVCNDSKNWIDQESSLLSIQRLLGEYEINVESDNRILPIIRFQSIYELCPENITALDSIFEDNE